MLLDTDKLQFPSVKQIVHPASGAETARTSVYVKIVALATSSLEPASARRVSSVPNVKTNARPIGMG